LLRSLHLLRSLRSQTSRYAVVICCVLAGALASCGKKGDPLPPLSLAPPAAIDFSVVQRGGVLAAELGYPSKTVSGLALPGLEAVELWRVDEPVSSTPAAERPMPNAKEFAAMAQLVQRVSGSELTSAVQGDRIVLRVPGAANPDPQLGRAVYAARTVAQGGDRSAFSNPVAFVPMASPAPPPQFSLASTPQGVVLSWTAVEGAVGYHVYRREASARGFGKPIHTAAPADTSFVDPDAAFARRYVYTVSTIARSTPLVESAPSTEREIDRQDRFGPPPPTRLVALPESGAVKLVWEASAAPDVVGYVVFRQDPGQGFRRVNSEPLAALEFIDRGLVARLTYSYRVAALDRVGNLGEPTTPIEATVR
jgi:hypothetical protein